MSSSGSNLAVTKDGEPYNKLQRPADYGASTDVPPPLDEVPPSTTSSKRKQDNAESIDDPDPEPKRSKRQRGASKLFDVDDHHHRAGPMRENGMQSMFPGLDDGDGSADEITQEALAYLRGVRTQASQIPDLLVAPPAALAPDEPDRSMYMSGRGDQRAVYVDGTWISVDSDKPSSSDEQYDLEPQEAYYHLLLRRYKDLRNQLARLDRRAADPEKVAEQKPPTSRHSWLYTLDREYPTPTQVVQIDDKTLYRGLEYCTHSLDRFDVISKQKSTWIWTLLALAGEPGILDHVRIGKIRDLGHKAGQLRIRSRGGSIRRPRGEHEEDEEQEEEIEEAAEIEVQDSEADEEASPEPEAVVNPSTAIENSMDIKNKEIEGEASDNSVDMSMSEGEQEGSKYTEPETLEEARARLLAQLGDRLVQPGLPSKQETGSQEQGNRHHHNGQVQRKETKQQKSESPEGRIFPSREEAERHRQEIREQKLAGPSMAYGQNDAALEMSVSEGPDTAPVQKIKLFSSRAEAEVHREEMLKRQREEDSQKSQKESHGNDGDAKVSTAVGSTESGVDMNTKGTIDMILTVVAEFYGQKDLLRYREVWGSEES